MAKHDPQMGQEAAFEDLLREAGLRVTQQRVMIVTILSQADDHPKADDILARLREMDDSVSFATVYRTLSTLEEAGLVRRIAVDNEPARFEMTPASDHDHLVDVDTGEVIEIGSEEMTALRHALAESLGYEILSHHTILRGRKIRR